MLAIKRCEMCREHERPLYALGVHLGDGETFGCLECLPKAFQAVLEKIELPREGAVFEALQLLSTVRAPDGVYGTGLKLLPVERAVLLLDGLQTEAERDSATTTEHNGVGWRGGPGVGDAKFGGGLAAHLRKKLYFSAKQRLVARRLLWKYCGQIARVAPTAPPAPPVPPAPPPSGRGTPDLFEGFG